MFLNEPDRPTVPPSGDPESKIAIVGEAPAKMEFIKGKPFVGPAGGVLETCLHAAGLTRSECYITNLAKYQTSGDKLYNPRKDSLTAAGQACAEELRSELSQVSANVIVPMGGSAAAALVGTGKITKVRGYMFDSTLLPGRKVIPTIHPAATLRGQFLLRHYIVHDLHKINKESEFPELRLPNDPIWVPRSFSEACQALDALTDSRLSNSYLSVDIETNNHEISDIGFALVSCGKTSIAVSIPMYSVNGPPYSLEEETVLWSMIAKLLARLDLPKLFQNGIFDQFFLIQRLGIYTEGEFDDTMVGHHILYPDFLKSLEFLGSLYTHRPHWKSMVSFKQKDKMKADD